MNEIADCGFELERGQTLEQWVDDFCGLDEGVIYTSEDGRYVWTSKRIFYFEYWRDDHPDVICWLLRDPPEGG